VPPGSKGSEVNASRPSNQIDVIPVQPAFGPGPGGPFCDVSVIGVIYAWHIC
jgi:hypothetical protein